MYRFLSILCAIIMLPLAAWAADNTLHTATDQTTVVRGNTLFATQLYAKLKNQSGNLFLSPASISTALAMTYGGARGDTATEMANTLHFTLGQDRLHPAMAKLLADLNAEGKARGYQLSMSNALWFQKGYPFQSDFIKLIKDNYGAGLNDVDFMGSTEVARKTINDWVDRQTAHKITHLIASGTLTQLTRLVLTDVIYFKGDWLTPFDKKETHNGDFHVTKIRPIPVPLMQRTGNFNYLDGGTFQAVEIPYKNNDLSLIVFLPRAIDGLDAFEQSMTAQHLEEWLANLKPMPEIQLTLPKFKVSAEFELDDTLKAMGMPQAFDSSADFSGMTGRRELFISQVIHKAYADVNEEGTEAAAATAVVMMQMAVMKLPPVVFRADHPFLFLIRDNHSGSILFLGRMSDPSQ